MKNVVLVSEGSPNKLILRKWTMGNKARFSTELSSHPGYAIVRMRGVYRDGIVKNLSYKTDMLGVGLKESALEFEHENGTMSNVSDGFILSASVATVSEGMILSLISRMDINEEDEFNEEKKRLFDALRAATLFSIGPDGRIFSTVAPHLCLGTYPYPCLHLVARGSPNQAVLKHFSDLLNLKESNLPTQGLANKSNCAFRLELSSHPGMGIVPNHHDLATPLGVLKGCLGVSLGLGPVEHALSGTINERNHLILSSQVNGFALCVVNKQLDSGNIVACGAFNELASFEFVFNDDGTISPEPADHLAIGFQVPGKAMFNFT
eukprot:CAMPEP_0194347638 /NCGR_PEP_ID=MMETSP0171-20130528/106103_1 /TAXON_ID=218684 /ORGANISM="Corethron pennatum, Strain L29A3" /LENGTH=320 /DNA_ID=CAMNT_0039114917 /DNA_START=897 /DNA_END=1859 /DNA_ORIENTATION=+